MSTPRLREIEREIAPLEAAHSDALRLDPALFARIDAVHAARHDSGLDDEAVRLVERYHLDFVLAGAQLDDAGRGRLTELNQELSTLSTTFGQNLSWPPRQRPCGSPTPPNSTASAPRRSPPRQRPRPTAASTVT